MSKSRVHFAVYKFDSDRNECACFDGDFLSAMSENTEEVDCENCKRTKAFKEASLDKKNKVVKSEEERFLVFEPTSRFEDILHCITSRYGVVDIEKAIKTRRTVLADSSLTPMGEDIRYIAIPISAMQRFDAHIEGVVVVKISEGCE